MNNDTNSAVGPVTLYLPMGVKIVLPPHLSCLSTYVILEQEDWFEEDVAFLRTRLRPGMNIIDVGANYGVYTLSLAKTVGETGQIWAVEPGSFAHDHLKKSIGANGFEQIILLKAALSSHQGTGFLAFGDSEELHRLAPVNADAPQQGENVFLITLDALMEQENFPAIDFLRVCPKTL